LLVIDVCVRGVLGDCGAVMCFWSDSVCILWPRANSSYGRRRAVPSGTATIRNESCWSDKLGVYGDRGFVFRNHSGQRKTDI